MKKVIISGWYGHANTGDEAILAAMMENLRKVMDGNVEFTVLSSNPQNVMKQHNVKSINVSLLRNHIGIIRTMKNTDLFILGGGGLLFDWYDKRIPWNIIHWLKPIILAKLMNKPVITYALGVGPIHSTLGKILTRAVLNRVDLITVRDLESKKVLDNIGVYKPPIYVTIDPAISLSQPDTVRINEMFIKENVPKNEKLVGISIRSWSMWNFKKYTDVVNVLAQVADYIVSKLNAFIVFIPMQFTEGDDDRHIEAAIFSNMCYKSRAQIITKEYTPQELSGIVGQMDMMIGMRLHSIIFAAATNVPMVGLVYDPKVKGFLDMIGQERYAIDIRDLNYNTLISKIDDAWNNKEKIKSDLESKMDEIKERALFNAELVRDLVLKNHDK